MGEKIKILYIIPCLSDGGLERMVIEWISGLDRDKYQVDFLALKTESETNKKRLEDLGVKVFDKDIRNRQIFKKKKYFMQVMKEGNYDILHQHTNFSGDYINLKYAKKCGIKTRICHGHLANPDHGKVNNIIHKFAKPLMRKYATIYTGCSEDAAWELVGKKGLKSDCYILMRNGIECDRFKFDKEKRKLIREKYDLTDKYVIGHAGRFEVEKNHSFLLDVFAECVEMNEAARLLLVGDGSLMQDVKDKATSLGVLDKIVFPGVVSNVEDYYAAMDVFAFPSIAEGFGLVLLEAECNGLNCIGSSEIVSDAFVLDSAKRMSLKRDAKSWAKALCEMKTDESKREACAEEIKKLGFDMKDNQVEKLYDFVR